MIFKFGIHEFKALFSGKRVNELLKTSKSKNLKEHPKNNNTLLPVIAPLGDNIYDNELDDLKEEQ